MQEFLEERLKQTIKIEPMTMQDKLPLVINGLYNLYSAEMNGLKWIMAEPKEKIGLAQMRKHQRQIEKKMGLNCALSLKQVNNYSENILLNEGIPFIIIGKEIYLPFIGILLNDCNKRTLTPVRQISFLTQKLILTAIYDKWNGTTVSDAAAALNVTKMSISRCFDEIEYLEIPMLYMKGKSRTVTISCDIKKLWDDIIPFLRNPIISEYQLARDLKLKNKSGISALCYYTLLSDNAYPTYAMTKMDIKDLHIDRKQLIPKGEEPGCVVQELGYFINFQNNNIMDPLSIQLALHDNEINDDRIIVSVNKMLEEFVW